MMCCKKREKEKEQGISKKTDKMIEKKLKKAFKNAGVDIEFI